MFGCRPERAANSGLEAKLQEDEAGLIVVSGNDTYSIYSKILADKSNLMVETEVKEVGLRRFKKVIQYMCDGTLEFDKETQPEGILDIAECFDMENVKRKPNVYIGTIEKQKEDLDIMIL